MANPLRGEATFTAGEADYTLLFDVNVFCDIEADTGLDLNGLVEKIEGRPSFTMLRDIICGGLQTKHPGTTKMQAGAIMTEAGLEEVTDALASAMQQAMPEVEDDAARPPNRKARRAARKK